MGKKAVHQANSRKLIIAVLYAKWHGPSVHLVETIKRKLLGELLRELSRSSSSALSSCGAEADSEKREVFLVDVVDVPPAVQFFKLDTLPQVAMFRNQFRVVDLKGEETERFCEEIQKQLHPVVDKISCNNLRV